MLNDDRVRVFAAFLRVLSEGSPVTERLKESHQEMDFEALVRAIADSVPYATIDFAAPVPTLITHNPYVPPFRLPSSDYPFTVPISPTSVPTIYGTSRSMSQADGQGDDSGTRGD